MKAIAITQAAADGDNIPFLTEIDLPIPTAHGRDLLEPAEAAAHTGGHDNKRRVFHRGFLRKIFAL